MQSIYALFENIMTLVQRGGLDVSEAEFELEIQLAMILGIVTDNDIDDAEGISQIRDELINRARLSRSEVGQIIEKLSASDWEVRYNLSILYNNLGLAYRFNAGAASEFDRPDEEYENLLASERCSEKALDMWGVSAEEILYASSAIPSQAFIMTFWNLGLIKYLLDKKAESQKYLQLCLRVGAQDDEQSIQLHQLARNLYEELVNGEIPA